MAEGAVTRRRRNEQRARLLASRICRGTPHRRLTLELLEPRWLLSAGPLEDPTVQVGSAQPSANLATVPLLVDPQSSDPAVSLEAPPQSVDSSMATATDATPASVAQATILRSEEGEIEDDASTTLPGNGLTPNGLKTLNGVNQIQFANGVKADGTGMTVAIVLGYDYPTVWADLQAFDQQFNLPDPPSFIRIAADGTRNYPTMLNPNGAREADMDTQMVHAMAPGANILFIEAASQSRTDVDNAIEYAGSLPGVDVASVSSNGTSEFSTETGYDVDYTTPTGHIGVTVIGSS